MQRCILLVALALVLASCASPVPTLVPQATYTPLPTYTPYPTFTPVLLPTSELVARPMSTATPRTVSSSPASSSASTSSCIAWKDAAAHQNEMACVRGVVVNTNQSGSTFFIDFDNTRTSFYGVSFKYTWDNLKGKCVEISGKIAPYNGRPQIVIEKQEQLKMCAN